LVELLTVVSIIGILLALLLPAVQQARESARAAECKNHLRQMSLALAMHAETFGSFPSSGWGWKWPPYPDHGFGDRQPGTWVFSILPYMEGAALSSPSVPNETRLATVLPWFHCPSRRAAELYPCTNLDLNAPVVLMVAKSDYAANTGDHNDPNAAGPAAPFVQPLLLSDGDNEGWWSVNAGERTAMGLIFQRSSIRMADILDGTTQTYLVGEKYLNSAEYTSGAGLGDLESIYHGDNDDSSRVTFLADGSPRQDIRGWDSRSLFGSAHPGGCHFAMADGSVRTVSYQIDPETNRRAGNRADGLDAGLSAY
jgi:prepilin-type processing-associated H-X9-DG protein